MKYKIYLRDSTTGLSRTVDMEVNEEDCADNDTDKSIKFIWFKHNNSCDCNRSLYLSNWGFELECNDNGPNVIVVDKIERYDGTLVDIGENR